LARSVGVLYESVKINADCVDQHRIQRPLIITGANKCAPGAIIVYDGLQCMVYVAKVLNID
jgi:hypothetical protein